jgi:hypothetical protein
LCDAQTAPTCVGVTTGVSNLDPLFGRDEADDRALFSASIGVGEMK